MQTDDSNGTPPPSSDLETDRQPALQWTLDLHTGNWIAIHSTNGYGRPDPEEFGQTTMDQTPIPANLIAEQVPHTTCREPIRFEKPPTSPSSTFGNITGIGRDIGLDPLRPTGDTPQELRTTDDQGAGIAGTIAGSCGQRAPEPAANFATSNEGTSGAVALGPKPGSMVMEQDPAPYDIGIDLRPLISVRDPMTFTGFAPIHARVEPAEPLHAETGEARFDSEAPRRPPALDLDLDLASVGPDRTRNQQIEIGPDQASTGHHSFRTGPIDGSEQPADHRTDHLEAAHQLLDDHPTELRAPVSVAGLTANYPDAIHRDEQRAARSHTLSNSGVTIPGNDYGDQASQQSELAKGRDAEHFGDLRARHTPVPATGAGTTGGLPLVDLELEAEVEEQGDGTSEVDGEELKAGGHPLSSDALNTDSSLNSEVPRSRARSLKTERAYSMHVRFLSKRSIDMRSPDPQRPEVVTALELTQDFIASRPTRSAASWQLYRAALLWYLVQHRHEDDSFEESYHLLASSAQKKTSPGPSRQRAAKKTITEDHLNQVIDTLGGMNRHVNWGSRTQFWLQAGLASGARPGEWNGASWLDETQTILCIPNGKRKTTVPIYSVVSPGQTIHDVEADNPERLIPGSASDETKRIRNVEIDRKDTLWVNLHMGALNSYLDTVPEEEREARFKAYYNMCRKVLRKACIKAFNGKKQYPLYVMRSQYAANMKAEMPLADVSARMGHEESGKTTKKDYGPRSAAHGGRGMLTPFEKQAKADARKSRADDARAAGKPVDRPPPESS